MAWHVNFGQAKAELPLDLLTYLKRVNYSAPVRPDDNTLRDLQLAHLLAVPFENLDIVPLHRPIQLTEHALWDKIVLHHRGGFCYELNGLFAGLLKQIGFEVTYLNGRVFKSDGELGSDFDHLALMVRTPGRSTTWLVDVGFGDLFMRPLSLNHPGEQAEGLRAYKLESTDPDYIVLQRGYDGVWRRQYAFDLRPRQFPGDYQAACHYHETSPQSGFTRKGVISKSTSKGRITLEESKLLITIDGRRIERPVVNRAEYESLLDKYFGAVL